MMLLDELNAIELVQKRQEPRFGEAEIDPTLREIFAQRGITKLYGHQADAIKLLQQGNNVCIAAPTSSGKTEIYVSAMFDSFRKGRRSLLIYPTKALSRDQSSRLGQFAIYGMTNAIYDGDTSQAERKRIREMPPSVMITNFDMLHHILLNHNLFSNFLKDLSIVVIDEAHTCNGIFGSHAANIIRRLKRIMSKKHKAQLRFVATSATIGNPKEFVEKIVGEPFEAVQVAFNSAEIRHYLVNAIGSPVTMGLKIAEDLDEKSLLFADSRSVVERVAYIGQKNGIKVEPYRAGIPQDERRKIENRFRQGSTRVLATTSALELGMDIGDVSTVVMLGFPPSISRARQRMGRAGRRGQQAKSIIVANGGPLDQYYMDHPDEFFSGEPESCYANPDNADILKYHLVSMASEMLLTKDEINDSNRATIEKLIGDGMLARLGSFVAATDRGKRFAKGLGIRGCGERVAICDDRGKEIGDRELPLALGELYEDAIYFSSGKPYVIERLDLNAKKAYARECPDPEFYTIPIYETEIEPEQAFEEKQINNEIGIGMGSVAISKSVVGYTAKEQYSGKEMGEHYFERPYVHNYVAHAFWLDVDEAFAEIENFPSGLHAYEHVFINMTPSVAGNSPQELGGLSSPDGRVYVYESVPNGIGIAKIIFNSFGRLAGMSLDRLSKCQCEKGCPKCILDAMCGNENKYLDKAAAKAVAGRIAKAARL
jgi:DEAD/DEAH box helicase domain-containing protein